MRACFETAQKYGLNGVIFFAYGSQGKDFQGIETNPALVAEIKGAAREFRSRPVDSSTKPGNQTR
jgi:hypothetical protein